MNKLNIAIPSTAAIASIYYNRESVTNNFFIPFLHKLDPEISHNIVINLLKYNITPNNNIYQHKSLNVNLWNKHFENPVGLAAGFDKDAKAYKSLSKFGFGFLELGSVTLHPQYGNPKPRIFRYDDYIVNRCGFNSDGLTPFVNRLTNDDSSINIIKGINIGKNKYTPDYIKDYQECITKLESYADYIVINISSPNTPGLRDLQKKTELEKLLSSITYLTKKPILIKLSPDLSDNELIDIINVSKKFKINGLIVSNTTKTKDGGLSGKPLKEKSNLLVSKVYKLTNGDIPIIGVGGISNGEDAYERIKNGATLIQIYTQFIIDGPKIIYQINQQLAELLKKDGYSNITQAIGSNHH